MNNHKKTLGVNTPHNMFTDIFRPPRTTTLMKPKIVSDGGSTAYYELPKDAKDLNDLIEAKHMSFARANIFKAVFRMSEKAGTNTEYDINKIILFAERLREMARKGIPL